MAERFCIHANTETMRPPTMSHIARKVAYIISGGDCAEGTLVTEQEILELEKEAFHEPYG